jgi:hypothetical protein
MLVTGLQESKFPANLEERRPIAPVLIQGGR